MEIGKVEARFGCEVYLSEEGNVCLRQSVGGEEDLIVLHPREARDIIPMIQDAANKAEGIEMPGDAPQ